MQNINNKMLTAAVLLFVGVLLTALLLQWWMAPAYKTDNISLHKMLSSGSLLIKPWQLNQMIDQNTIANVSLVLLNGADLAQKERFGSHIALTSEHLLAKETMKFLKLCKTVFVLAPDESAALAATWVYRAKGLNHVYAIANNAAFVEKRVIDNYHPKWAQTTAEQARFNFANFFGNAPKLQAPAPNFAPQTGGIQVKKAAGGC
jgi:hypothetical protein